MKIELTTQEMELAELLGPFTISLDEPDELRENKLKASSRLMHSLLDRDAIPKVRIKYFTQPEYNLASSRKSRQQMFEHTGKSGSRIFEDPAFLKYLKYFVYGADLPWELKVDLQAAKSNAYNEDEFIDEACFAVNRHRASVAGDNQLLAEEVFKYALELGIDLAVCKHLWEEIRN